MAGGQCRNLYQDQNSVAGAVWSLGLEAIRGHFLVSVSDINGEDLPPICLGLHGVGRGYEEGSQGCAYECETGFLWSEKF